MQHAQNKSYALKPGQKIFEVHLITGKIQPAQYLFNGLALGLQKPVLKERKDCIYLPARSEQEAKKVFDKIAMQARKF